MNAKCFSPLVFDENVPYLPKIILYLLPILPKRPPPLLLLLTLSILLLLLLLKKLLLFSVTFITILSNISIPLDFILGLHFNALLQDINVGNG